MTAVKRSNQESETDFSRDNDVTFSYNAFVYLFLKLILV